MKTRRSILSLIFGAAAAPAVVAVAKAMPETEAVGAILEMKPLPALVVARVRRQTLRTWRASFPTKQWTEEMGTMFAQSSNIFADD